MDEQTIKDASEQGRLIPPKMGEKAVRLVVSILMLEDGAIAINRPKSLGVINTLSLVNAAATMLQTDLIAGRVAQMLMSEPREPDIVLANHGVDPKIAERLRTGRPLIEP